MRPLALFPARESMLRKCTTTESPTLHSMTGPGIVPMVPESVGLGSLISQGFTLRSSGAAQFGVYLLRMRASPTFAPSIRGLYILTLLRVAPVTGDFKLTITAPALKFWPVIRSLPLGAVSQAWFSI